MSFKNFIFLWKASQSESEVDNTIFDFFTFGGLFPGIVKVHSKNEKIIFPEFSLFSFTKLIYILDLRSIIIVYSYIYQIRYK